MRALFSILTHHRTNRRDIRMDIRKLYFWESFFGQKLVVSWCALQFVCLHRHASQKKFRSSLSRTKWCLVSGLGLGWVLAENVVN